MARYSILLVALAAIVASATSALAADAPAQRSTAAAPPASTANPYQRGYRRGWFSGRSSKNWNLNRGTPDDNSTIPTPLNRNPKGRPEKQPRLLPQEHVKTAQRTTGQGMWYLAEILLAEAPKADRQSHQCESCNVVFEAATAVDGYRKAVAWGEEYAAEPPGAMQFVGVVHLTTVGEELGDGVEICGRFFECVGPWDRVAEFIPPAQSLKALIWEDNQDTPIADLLTHEQIAQLRKRLGSDSERTAEPAEGEA
jgi:hypothetical protein